MIPWTNKPDRGVENCTRAAGAARCDCGTWAAELPGIDGGRVVIAPEEPHSRKPQVRFMFYMPRDVERSRTGWATSVEEASASIDDLYREGLKVQTPMSVSIAILDAAWTATMRWREKETKVTGSLPGGTDEQKHLAAIAHVLGILKKPTIVHFNTSAATAVLFHRIEQHHPMYQYVEPALRVASKHYVVVRDETGREVNNLTALSKRALSIVTADDPLHRFRCKAWDVARTKAEWAKVEYDEVYRRFKFLPCKKCGEPCSWIAPCGEPHHPWCDTELASETQRLMSDSSDCKPKS
jgi:hypothetical protein